MTAARADERHELVWAELARIPDPEIPAISVVDLGVIGSVEIDARRVRVELLPTFVGCPAIGVMQERITERLGLLGIGAMPVHSESQKPITNSSSATVRISSASAPRASTSRSTPVAVAARSEVTPPPRPSLAASRPRACA